MQQGLSADWFEHQLRDLKHRYKLSRLAALEKIDEILLAIDDAEKYATTQDEKDALNDKRLTLIDHASLFTI